MTQKTVTKSDMESIRRYGLRQSSLLLIKENNKTFLNRNFIFSNSLKIIIDSKSFNKLLLERNEDVKKILNFSGSKFFKFIRSPFESDFEEINNLPELRKIYDNNGNISKIEVLTSKTRSKTSFNHNPAFINDLHQILFKRSNLKDEEIYFLELILFTSTLKNFGDQTCLLVTDNDILLKNRLRLKKEDKIFSGSAKELNIVTIQECKEIMDLFLKFRHQYLLCAKSKITYSINRGLWYWFLFRSKIPNFHVGYPDEPYLDAFSTRFVFLLRSIDEIGFKYYSVPNNDTLDDTMFHFNYIISLIAGIFDALALVTKNKYQLDYGGDSNPERTSLNPKAGKKYFLKTLREENLNLRTHINNYVNFIKLIYEIRELVVHRKMLEGTQVIRKNSWQINGIIVDKSILKYIPKSDKMQKYKPVTEWGIHKLNDDDIILEPFTFVKMLLKILYTFSNYYLKLMGYNDFLDEIRKENPKDQFLIDIESFIKGNLGG